jgi:nucleoside-triphosphatase THEP1
MSWASDRDFMRIAVICGAKDSGKTRAAEALSRRLRRQGLRVGGVISEAAMSEGTKTRYTFRDLSTGRQSLYALRKQGVIPQGVPSYAFLAEGMEFGCAAVRRAAADAVDALFVDEIGPLEAAGGGLWAPCREILAAFTGRIVLTVRPSLLNWLLGQPGMREAAVRMPEEAESIFEAPEP